MPKGKKKKQKSGKQAGKNAGKSAGKKAGTKTGSKASQPPATEPEIWQVEGFPEQHDRFVRGHYIIPALLHDTETKVHIKAVILDLSATGARVFTNDRRVRIMDRSRLMGHPFRLEFDFHDVDTSGILATVRHIQPGKNPDSERQLGLEFTSIEPEVSRNIRDRVQADVARHKA